MARCCATSKSATSCGCTSSPTPRAVRRAISLELQSAVRSLEPTGASTRLGQGVRSILNDLRGTPPTAIVLLTDGINTEGEALSEAAALARRKGVPLFAVALGDEHPVRDLELSDLLVDEVVFVDDVVNFEFKLTGAGLAGRKVEVVLKDKNQAEPLARTTVTVGDDGQSAEGADCRIGPRRSAISTT